MVSYLSSPKINNKTSADVCSAHVHYVHYILPTYLMTGAQVLGLKALRKSGRIVQLIVRRVDIQEQHTAQLQQVNNMH